ncbi:protein BatD [Dysgonomonas sp. Marseille-P4677]|uniref:BatD family protein n=1 Tax=Dysgonomonas sp. Marseille-P4677 TaxID=2364790 RepID=UPI0019145B4F|nr:BatD family protein [Dysgonomonas sp. Marseille-P4677]MBK5721599.1 protein BatD [Dysgonomonas sp. Marseille-P4677]
MKKYFILSILLLIGISKIFADDITFVISAPATTVKGAQVQLQYILKGGEGRDLQVPDDIKGFDVLYGPSVSQMYSSSNINGKVTSESNITYTYLLMAKDEGTFTLPAASVKVNGRNYKSNTAQIKVLPPDKNAKPQQPGERVQATTSSSTAANVSASDAFIRAIFSKTKVKEQEAVTVTFRFYTVLNIRNVGKIQFPEFEGFMTEDFDLPANRQMALEHYNGRNYYTIDVKKTLLFPQRSGKMTIPAGTMEIVFEVASGKKVQTFFGPQEVMTEAKKVLKTTPVTVDVTALPIQNKPVGFSGAVGDFSFKPSISAEKIKANDAVTIKLDITGTGNLKLIKNPEIKFPKDFETYDANVKNDFKLTENGLSGTKSIEYMFIPRYPGKFTIPAIEFSYFDTKSNTYKTISSPSYTLDVDKDPNAGKNVSTSYSNQRELEVEQDIRYLKTGKYSFTNPQNFFVGSVSYILWYAIPLVLFVAFVIAYRKQIKANADIALMRTKKANKVATKRLKLAKQYLQANKKDNFYEEILRAVWGYLSDKLTIPVSELNRENIENELTKYGVDEILINQFIGILDTGEFARYAPSESEHAMDDLYSDTVDAIGKMESTIKKINK